MLHAPIAERSVSVRLGNQHRVSNSNLTQAARCPGSRCEVKLSGLLWLRPELAAYL